MPGGPAPGHLRRGPSFECPQSRVTSLERQALGLSVWFAVTLAASPITSLKKVACHPLGWAFRNHYEHVHLSRDRCLRMGRAQRAAASCSAIPWAHVGPAPAPYPARSGLACAHLSSTRGSPGEPAPSPIILDLPYSLPPTPATVFRAIFGSMDRSLVQTRLLASLAPLECRGFFAWQEASQGTLHRPG